MTFFVALHLTLGRKMDICGRVNLFFALHLILGEKPTASNCPPYQIPGHATVVYMVLKSARDFI